MAPFRKLDYSWSSSSPSSSSVRNVSQMLKHKSRPHALHAGSDFVLQQVAHV